MVLTFFFLHHFVMLHSDDNYIHIISESGMPPCIECHFPYATVEKCKNCGSTNPLGRKEEEPGFFATLFGMIILGAIGTGIYYLYTNFFR